MKIYCKRTYFSGSQALWTRNKTYTIKTKHWTKTDTLENGEQVIIETDTNDYKSVSKTTFNKHFCTIEKAVQHIRDYKLEKILADENSNE
jgi:hypothetical protein